MKDRGDRKMNSSFLMDELLETFKQVQEDRKKPNWFSLTAISNVPYVKYPGLTEEECKEVRRQCVDIMRTSWHNRCKEVSVVYRLDAEDAPDKYKQKVGTETSSEFDKEIADAAQRDGKLVIVALHNHPDNSGFSPDDLNIFCHYSCIRLMVIINGSGEISFLSRSEMRDYKRNMSDCLNTVAPNFVDRMDAWKVKNPGKSPRFIDLIPETEKRAELAELVLASLISDGVVYFPYPGQDMPQNMEANRPDVGYSVPPLDFHEDSSEIDDNFSNR